MQLLIMDNLEFENLIGYNIGKASHLMINAFHRSLQQLGLDITLHQLGMLHFIRCHGESNQQELAEVMSKDKSAILRSVDILERKGYVNRVADANDRRKNILTVTPKAEEMIEAAKPHFLIHMQEMTKNISPEEIELCIKVTRKLQDNARQFIEQSK